MVQVVRTERTILRESCKQYALLKQFCFEAKNLYNYANYILRQNYKNKDYSLHNFYALRQHLRHLKDPQNPWIRQPTTRVASEVVQSLTNAWKSYFAVHKSFATHPEKFEKAPRPPQYLPKNGAYLLTTYPPDIKYGSEILRFPKSFMGLTVPFRRASAIKTVQIIPRHKHVVIVVAYHIEVPDIQCDNSRYLSIDLGVDNFATITSNVTGFQSVVLNGKGLKALNQYYNKQKAHYQGVAQQMNGMYNTNRLKALAQKRGSRIHDQLHKMSKLVINLAVEWDCSNIVVGYNAGWKRGVELGKRNNQNFVQLPYLRFIQQLQYKAENVGKVTTVCEESYTSKTSFLDNEFPERHYIYGGHRTKRGLFESADGRKINADCNGSYQILKKVFPNAYSNGIEGVSLHPLRVNAVEYQH